MNRVSPPVTADIDITDAYRLGRDRRYLTWLTSDTATGLSSALASFAIPLIALAVTDSPVRAGVIGALGMVGRLVTTLIGGVLADRHARVALMTLGALVGLAVAVGFTLLAARDALTFATLLALALILSARGGLFDVAGEAAIKQIVPSAAMGRAQAANQGRDAALSLAGGPLGGVLLGVGAWVVGAAMVVCQSVALATALMLRRRANAPGAETPPRARSMRSELGEGARWLWRRTDLRGVLLVATIVNLGFTTAMTSVIYDLQLTGHSPAQIGAFSAIIAAAMLLGALLSPPLVSRVSAGTLIITGLVLATAGVIVVALVQGFTATVSTLAVSVLGIPALNAALLGYLTVATPGHLLGRVNSAVRVMSMGAMPLAPLVAGVGLAGVGLPGTVGIGAAICVVAVTLTLSTRALRELPVENAWTAHAARFAVSPE